MPEGDIVWQTAHRLHQALAGQVLTRCDVRVPRFATADLSGRTVTQALSRGKHLLIRVQGGITVHSHLRMEGSWLIRPAATRVANSHQIRLILANRTWQATGYRLAMVAVVPTAAEDGLVGHLGPDLLGPGWDAGLAVARLLASPSATIGEALMDQRNLAGIGNLYRAEVLFLHGVGPWRPVAEVADLVGLVTLAQRLLDANKDNFDQVTTGIRRPGEQRWVYRRAGRPCRRCRATIRAAAMGGEGEERTVYWCPQCQP